MEHSLVIPVHLLSAVAGRHKHHDWREALAETLVKSRTTRSWFLPLPPREEDSVPAPVRPRAAVDELCTDWEESLALLCADEEGSPYADEEGSPYADEEVLLCAAPAAQVEEPLPVPETLLADVLGPGRASRAEYELRCKERLLQRHPGAGARAVKRAQGEWMRERGRRLEGTALGALADMGLEVRESPVLSATVVVDGAEVIVIGKADGVLYTETVVSTVIEVKNRVRRFMTPEYDLDQLAAYVHLADARDGGILVERLNGLLDTTNYSFRELEARWARVLGGLRRAVRYSAAARRDPGSKELLALRRALKQDDRWIGEVAAWEEAWAAWRARAGRQAAAGPPDPPGAPAPSALDEILGWDW
jgi:hypothetical protein